MHNSNNVDKINDFKNKRCKFIETKTTYEKNHRIFLIYLSICVKGISCRMKGFQKSVSYLLADIRTMRFICRGAQLLKNVTNVD